ncbi:hypothetical protein CCAX7_13180 [Capsulimonas corticalis]|uniref:Uncharacterized protein n=1 Tax=Capsulimonas corticalis TaxID=2219043 RepID=A0A402D4U6_9BACT|nr:DUF1778 domain-containing protein [Capsulimonas corticalis]BDI29267.1 hypothetical protein CCAX7_13180 [Capsulimonas corticalis]
MATTKISTEKSSERVNLRVSPSVKGTIEDAAGELGMTVNAFIVNLALERATQVLMERRVIRMDNEARDRFLALLDKTDGPNEALREAADDFNKGYFEDGVYHFQA